MINIKKGYNTHDDYTTPYSAWDSIKDFIPKDKIIWEAFYCNGSSGDILKELGFNVIHKNEDFFDNNYGDIVVSNPPYSIKQQIIERLVKLDKPFILIMPIITITYKYIRELLGDELQLIIPRKRIHFIKIKDGQIEKQKSQCSFDSAYFCWKMNLQRDIIFLK